LEFRRNFGVRFSPVEGECDGRALLLRKCEHGAAHPIALDWVLRIKRFGVAAHPGEAFLRARPARLTASPGNRFIANANDEKVPQTAAARRIGLARAPEPRDRVGNAILGVVGIAENVIRSRIK
jgi:hypothetical protein